MTNEEFKKVVVARFSKCLDVLTAKSHEYAPGEDRLQQFKDLGVQNHVNPIKIASVLMSKQTWSIHSFADNPTKYSPAQWTEKLCDTIVYSLLIEGLLTEMWENQNEKED